MFDVGFSELLIIAVVALLVLGPERLPKAARFAGLWVRKARAQWYSVKSELELELAQEEMKKHLQEAENSIKAPVQALSENLQQTETEINRDFDEVAEAVRAGHRTESGSDGAEMDAPSDNATPAPDGPVDERPAEDGPDDTKPKQGALW
jgi:sec-independent protein translocase protein TatB